MNVDSSGSGNRVHAKHFPADFDFPAFPALYISYSTGDETIPEVHCRLYAICLNYLAKPWITEFLPVERPTLANLRETGI